MVVVFIRGSIQRKQGCHLSAVVDTKFSPSLLDETIVNKFSQISDIMAEPETKKTKVDERASTTTAKKAIITGITGQDGSYLAEFLLEKVSAPLPFFLGTART